MWMGLRAAVGAPARHQEAGQAGLGLRKRQKGVRHRCRAEPFVADQHMAAVAGRLGPGAVGAQVRAALLLGHRHADQGAPLGGDRPRAGVVVGRQDLGRPSLGDLGGFAQRGQRREGHGERAADAALDLIEQKRRGGPDDVDAGSGIDPGQSVDLLGDRPAHQLVPGGMELDLVDPVAEAVVAVQHRRVLVGLLAEPERRGLAEPGAEAREPVLAPAAALAGHGLAQRRVLLEQVGVLERRRLVQNLVGGESDRLRPHAISPRRERATRGRARLQVEISLTRVILKSC